MIKYLIILLAATSMLWRCGTVASGYQLLPQDMSEERYTATAVGILPDGTVQEGPAEIVKYWRSVFTASKVSDRMVIGSVPVGKEGEYRYEISRFKTGSKQAFTQVIVWDNQGSEPLRALQLIAPNDKLRPDTNAIFAARTRWMEYCNGHEVEQLIQEMYAPNTCYYNHRPLLQGRAALEKEYTYMKDPSYQLTLTPIHVVPVSEHLVMELGQCSGSYGGKYLLVWQEQEKGGWQVLLDANL
ncbi:hypothetical protein [Lewinella sp. LCG006]|uniref:hypothetical protein n=1 Tax=Lewinella sp. LCG006 TaxID=3231911 RepID=UPI00345FBCE6